MLPLPFSFCMSKMHGVTYLSLILNILVSNEKANERTYVSKADIRKNMRRMRNGPGRNQSLGGRAENSKGFLPNSFDRVLLDAPCSALGLRPRLFAGEVGQFCLCWLQIDSCSCSWLSCCILNSVHSQT